MGTWLIQGFIFMSIRGRAYIKVISRLLLRYKDVLRPERKPNLNALRHTPCFMFYA